ncbi:hypothetical protein BX666DRAFT_1942268 [Dichotomocladium elegans]|nr:hypothetical protein BX666DRAFT_1942268 [Dichotomocladium elegans]
MHSSVPLRLTLTHTHTYTPGQTFYTQIHPLGATYTEQWFALFLLLRCYMKHVQNIYKILLRPYTLFFGHPSQSNHSADDNDSLARRLDPATRLHFDLMCLVLNYLAIPSLLECTGVSQTWFACVVFMPNFWDRMAKEMPFVSRSFAESVLFRKTSHFVFEGPMLFGSLCGHLEFLQHAGTVFQHGIALKSIELACAARSLTEALSHTTLAELSIVGCILHASQLRPVLAAACHVSKLTIERISPPIAGFHLSTSSQTVLSSKGRAWPEGTAVNLRYFKLSLGRDRSYFQWALDTLLPPKAMTRCTQLEHLFLDAKDQVAHMQYISEAAKASNCLKSLVVAPDAEIPSNTVLPWRQQHAQGELCLVLSGILAKDGTPSVMTAIETILRKYHRSLALIHMEGGWTVTPDVYCTLGSMMHSISGNYVYRDACTGVVTSGSDARSAAGSRPGGGCTVRGNGRGRDSGGGAPRLRELRLSAEVGMRSWDEESAFAQGLASLLKVSPFLEALTLAGPRRIDAAGLAALARYCPNLRYLALASQHPIHVSGLLEMSRFAKRLEVLRLSSYCEDMNGKMLADIVNNLPGLRRIVLRQQYYPSKLDFSAAYELLRQRGVTLYAF